MRTESTVERRRGFTLVELLVVLGVSAILLAILLGPLGRALGIVSRTQAKIEGQDVVRDQFNQLRSELSQAMYVGDPRPLTLYVPSLVRDVGGLPQPDAANSQPIPITVDDGMLVLALPKRRFYCTLFDHFLVEPNPNQGAPGNTDLVSPLLAINTCPRPGHEQSPLERRPSQPLEVDNFWVQDSAGNWINEKILVVYFIGLKEPGFKLDPKFNAPQFADSTPPGINPNGFPQYHNPEFFAGGIGSFANTYVLYRAEFDPNPASPDGLRTANWFLPGGNPNPNFFYDPAFRDNWKVRAVGLLPMEHTDILRWALTSSGFYEPRTMTSFAPMAVDSEVAQPNRVMGPIFPPGGVDPRLIGPQEFTTQHGHWVGPQARRGTPLPGLLVLGPNPVVNPNWRRGARIQVVQRSVGGEALVYDSQTPARGRLVSMDPNAGVVSLAIQRNGLGGARFVAPDIYNATVQMDPATLLPIVDLGQDNVAQTVAVGGVSDTVPGSLGAARLVFPNVRVVAAAMTSLGSATAA